MSLAIRAVAQIGGITWEIRATIGRDDANIWRNGECYRVADWTVGAKGGVTILADLPPYVLRRLEQELAAELRE